MTISRNSHHECTAVESGIDRQNGKLLGVSAETGHVSKLTLAGEEYAEWEWRDFSNETIRGSRFFFAFDDQIGDVVFGLVLLSEIVHLFLAGQKFLLDVERFPNTGLDLSATSSPPICPVT